MSRLKKGTRGYVGPERLFPAAKHMNWLRLAADFARVGAKESDPKRLYQLEGWDQIAPYIIQSIKIRFMLDLIQLLTGSCCLIYLLGIWGIWIRRSNIIIILMSIELMLLAVNLSFTVFSYFLDDFYGQVISLFALSVAAAESAIGLAILVVYYRLTGSILIDFASLLKG